MHMGGGDGGRLTLGARVEISLEGLQNTRAQGEAPRFEKLRVANRQRHRLQIEIVQRQAAEFSQPETGTIGHQHHGGERQRA